MPTLSGLCDCDAGPTLQSNRPVFFGATSSSGQSINGRRTAAGSAYLARIVASSTGTGIGTGVGTGAGTGAGTVAGTGTGTGTNNGSNMQREELLEQRVTEEDVQGTVDLWMAWRSFFDRYALFFTAHDYNDWLNTQRQKQDSEQRHHQLGNDMAAATSTLAKQPAVGVGQVQLHQRERQKHERSLRNPVHKRHGHGHRRRRTNPTDAGEGLRPKIERDRRYRDRGRGRDKDGDRIRDWDWDWDRDWRRSKYRLSKYGCRYRSRAGSPDGKWGDADVVREKEEVGVGEVKKDFRVKTEEKCLR